jgi:ankyrin repeat protein
MKHTLAHCQDVFNDHIIAAHFFNARGDSLEKTPLGMLRSLLFQLVEKEPAIYGRFVLIFREKCKKHKMGEWEWQESELKDFLRLELGRYQSKSLLILVDALDECRESDVREVVEFLEELSVKAVDIKYTLHICLSSRHYPHIRMKKRLELVVEENMEHNDDIATYVRDKLTKDDEEIIMGILKKASGIFMWVVLVVRMLNIAYDDGKVEAMHQKLREVPSNLEEVFETLLSKDSPDKHETILMLQWVLFTRRLLRPEELYFAMIAGTNADNLKAWDSSKVTEDDIRRRITSSSRGLIEVRKGSQDTVQFIHESVNDFLLRNQRLENLDPSLNSNPIGISHDHLRACCLSYILMDGLPLPTDRTQAIGLDPSYPFLAYASIYIFYHTEEAEIRNIGQAEFLQRLGEEHDTFERVRLFHNSFEDSPSICARDANLLHISAGHGYKRITKILLEKGPGVNTQGGGCGTALQAAAYRGEEKIVAMLLDNGADVNIQGGIFDTALHAAVLQGEEEIVAMLLNKGANANIRGGGFGIVLQAAAFKDEENIVVMLLENGADVNALGRVYGTALQAAAKGGNKNIVAMLLENGADVNMRGGVYGTALQAAALGSEDEIVMMLLEKGAEVNTKGGIFCTALQAVSLGIGNEKKIVKILLEKGADINAQGGLYGTALQSAAAVGKDEIVAMLLEKGADIDTQGGAFGTALQAAALQGNEKIMAMLLEKGAHVNVEGGGLSTALQAAAAIGRDKIVAMLLDKGVHANTQGGVWDTALVAAAIGGEEKIVKALLEKGADANIQTEFIGTALQAAVADRATKTVAMLLEKGADVNAIGGPFGATLSLAAVQDSADIVEMLLENGANVNIQEGVFGTALQAAAIGCNENIMMMLLDKGATINFQEQIVGTTLRLDQSRVYRTLLKVTTILLIGIGSIISFVLLLYFN